MLGFYNYTVILTYMGLACSFIGMVNALQGNIRIALLCLMLSGLCDMFDGKVARTRKSTDLEKRFGIQIDSLCDLICFGVFPAIIGYGIGIRSVFGLFCMFIYVLSALIRLSYFNVMEEERQNGTTEKRKNYEGLPVTTVAIIIPAVFLLKLINGIPFAIIYPIILLILSGAFTIKFNVKKPIGKEVALMVSTGMIVFILVAKFGGRL